MAGTLVRRTVTRPGRALLVATAAALAAALTVPGGLLDPPAAHGHEPHGFYLDCPVSEVAEGQPVVVKISWVGHDEPDLVMRTYVTTVEGTAGPADYVAQHELETEWWDVSSGRVNDGLFQFDWTVATIPDTLPEFDETFTVFFGPPDELDADGDPVRHGHCEITIIDDDAFALPDFHHQNSGVWSDGDTIWVSNWGYDAIHAYALDGTRRPNQDFTALGAAGNGDAHGIWSDGITMWVADWNDPKLYAYDMATKAHDPAQDIPLHPDNARPLDIWSDGLTMWVADAEDHKIYAYNLIGRRWPLGERRPSWDISFDSAISAFGIWSDGSIMWVADGATGALRAHTLAGARLPSRDLALDAANGAPRGIWSDGIGVYVLQNGAARIFPYQMPLGLTMSIEPTVVVEEWQAQQVAITVGLLGGRSVPFDTDVDLRFTEHTTDDDFELERLSSLTLKAGSNNGTATVVLTPTDDVDDEDLEFFAITAIMTHPGTSETMVSRLYVPFLDNDPVPASIPDLAVRPVAGDTSKLRVSWGSVTDAEVYRVEWKEGTDPSTAFFSPVTGFTTGFSGVIDNLAAGTTYTVRLSAIDADDGNAVVLVSSELAGTTLGAMGDVTVSATEGTHDSLDVSWPAVTGATGYRVEWKPAFGSYRAVGRSDASATTETLTGLSAYSGYTVKVTALHTIDGQAADGEWAEATGATNSEQPVSATDAADGLEAWLVTGGVALSWDGVGDTVDDKPVTAFTMQWAEAAAGPWATLNYPGEGLYCIPKMNWDYMQIDGETFTQCYFEYALAGDLVVDGTTYYYRLIAHADGADSQPGPVYSAEANAPYQPQANVGGL